jgi:hypothetical protein
VTFTVTFTAASPQGCVMLLESLAKSRQCVCLQQTAATLLQASKLAPAAWAAFTEGEGDGYGGPLSVLFDEAPPSAAKDVMHKVPLLL